MAPPGEKKLDSFLFSLYIRLIRKKEALPMHTSTTVQPGQRGAKKFLAQYGDRLVCVRYRSDAQQRKRFKTIELIVEEWPWTPPPPRRTAESVVLVKVGFAERELRQRVKDAGGVWHPDKHAWEVRYDRVVALGVTERIVAETGC
jgi:hypothetical protein